MGHWALRGARSINSLSPYTPHSPPSPLLPIPYALCPMPHALHPTLHSLTVNPDDEVDLYFSQFVTCVWLGYTSDRTISIAKYYSRAIKTR
ncbi:MULTISPECIES: hypothetical protein [Nostoc]|uniref:Uncharacterized protein n=1 Tax=Nostoc paludosum FACHB-159 TaxID=2692908 RepID=A0ABR8K8Z0_9NOSO|nr:MULTISPECIES: hypothetical protein [Nostoc]MBD2678764.1 hypothetical protein [Nostoc sp. FACHB-857]MBD2734813.1 hypothetical protein [Nostoc paludosum FACHB-159]